MQDANSPPAWHIAVMETMRIVILLICILGIVANLICLVVMMRKRMKSSFNTILIGLTLFDLLLLLKAMFTSLNQLTNYSWPLNQTTWAPKLLFLLSWLCDAGTKYFTVGVSLERFIAICHPIKSREILTQKTSRIFAACLTLYIVALSGANFFLRFYSNNLLSESGMNIVKAVFLNFGPFLAIVGLNIAIYAQIQKSNTLRKSDSKSEVSSSVTRMLLTVVLVFGFCYSFECTRRIIGYFVTLDLERNTFHFILNQFADLFYVLNSCVNFLIYYLLGKKFRAEFLSLFLVCTPVYLGLKKSKNDKPNTASTESSNTQTKTRP